MSGESLRVVALLAGLIAAFGGGSARAQEEAFARTERRAPCARYEPLRQPFFGDLHVHTSFSFDSYVAGQRNDPRAAYRFARGESIELPGPDGSPVALRLRRPLDFAAVTDHSEFLGELELCTGGPWRLAYWSPTCVATRSSSFWLQLAAARTWANRLSQPADRRRRAFVCSLPGSHCAQRAAGPWREIQRAAEEAYDRQASCRFTTFIGYEYTETAPGLRNLHRNVIFRNERVPELPISAYESGAEGAAGLWRRLRAECLERGSGCDVLAIPHNSNLSGGLEFAEPRNRTELRDRAELEPVAEIVQHKGASECRFDRLAGRGVGTRDELCAFEQLRGDNLAAALGTVDGEPRSALGAPVPIERFASRNLLRNALAEGLALEQRTGTNPFKLGFVGSTDTHSAAPGAVAEDAFVSHLARRDAGWRAIQDHFFENPGGLAVVWAEENARDALFDALRRRETYATSGTRPIVRFFGGWEFHPKLCERPDLVRQGYSIGVPMGSDLPPDVGGRAPRFVVSAQMDAGVSDQPGTPLQRIQIVKVWVDQRGEPRERVVDVAGDAHTGWALDRRTCTPDRAGSAALCAVWEDREFNARVPALYYARVLEIPTCRWSTHQCLAAGVNPFASDCRAQAETASRAAHERGAKGDVYRACCTSEREEPFYSPVIQERAWTSPIWYRGY
jgi:hypothetical protein